MWVLVLVVNGSDIFCQGGIQFAEKNRAIFSSQSISVALHAVSQSARRWYAAWHRLWFQFLKPVFGAASPVAVILHDRASGLKPPRI
jgi:hypothetical protein